MRRAGRRAPIVWSAVSFLVRELHQAEGHSRDGVQKGLNAESNTQHKGLHGCKWKTSKGQMWTQLPEGAGSPGTVVSDGQQRPLLQTCYISRNPQEEPPLHGRFLP